MSRSHSQVAADVRSRKEARPDLYCPKCLWMTGDGSACPRHGGPAWSPERAARARAKALAPTVDPGVVRLSPAERAVLATVRGHVTPCPLLRTGVRAPHAARLVERGLLVLRWSSSDRAFDYYGLTRLGEEVAAVVGAS